MRVPLRWLKDYVSIPCSAEELAEKLTYTGIKVEQIEPAGENISKVTVGEIVAMEKHPNADKLSVTKVLINNQDEPLQIVTGATNVKKGDRIPVAEVGATLSGGKKIEKAKLRGETSLGMMCSAKELGLDGRSLPLEQQTGVMILGNSIPIGTNFIEYLGLNDYILHFEVFANRPDLLGIIGIAREVAALLGEKLIMPVLYGIPGDSKVNVELIASDLSPYYTARLIEGVKVAPSPLWLQTRLQHAGIRSINNIVDITNYVMLEYGQPLHAFDFDLLNTGAIVIRKAVEGEEILTIDGEKRSLEPWMLVIADKKSPIAIAGVMGGKESEITEKTSRVLLEAASFDPRIVRRTSIKLGFRSESSRRFEKGLDPHQVQPASSRATWLMNQHAETGSFIASNITASGNDLPPNRTISFRAWRATHVLGEAVKKDAMCNLLEKSGFALEPNRNEQNDSLLVKVPTYRKDINEEIDLIEEIARLSGYDTFPETFPKGVTVLGKQSELLTKETVIRDLLIKIGLQEVITYGVVEDPELRNKYQTSNTQSSYTQLANTYIRILNPLSIEQGALRNSLFPGLLKACCCNQQIKNNDLAIFEIGKIFSKNYNSDILETKSLGLLLSGSPFGKNITFFDLKGIVEQLGQSINLTPLAFTDNTEFPFVNGHSAAIYYEENRLGYMGLLDEETLKYTDIDTPADVVKLLLNIADVKKIAGPVFTCILNLDIILNLCNMRKRFTPLPRYPEIVRDIAMLINDNVKSADLLEEMKNAGGEILKKIRFFDSYTGAQIPEGKKSYAYSLIYQSDERTLTDDEVNNIHSQIKESLKQKSIKDGKEGWELSFRE